MLQQSIAECASHYALSAVTMLVSD